MNNIDRGMGVDIVDGYFLESNISSDRLLVFGPKTSGNFCLFFFSPVTCQASPGQHFLWSSALMGKFFASNLNRHSN